MVRSVISATCASALIAAAATVSAVPAHAAASPSTVALSCNTSNVMSAGGQATVNINAEEGDVITFTSTLIRGYSFFPNPLTSGYSVSPLRTFLENSTLTLTVGSASTSLTIGPDGGVECKGTGTFQTGTGTVTLNITVGGGGGSPTTSGADETIPAPLLQQFGKRAVGTCEVAAPESLNWSGVTSGGWSESWAQWMNGGNGGAVCTRTLVYNTGQSRWVIG